MVNTVFLVKFKRFSSNSKFCLPLAPSYEKPINTSHSLIKFSNGTIVILPAWNGPGESPLSGSKISSGYVLDWGAKLPSPTR